MVEKLLYEYLTFFLYIYLHFHVFLTTVQSIFKKFRSSIEVHISHRGISHRQRCRRVSGYGYIFVFIFMFCTFMFTFIFMSMFLFMLKGNDYVHSWIGQEM